MYKYEISVIAIVAICTFITRVLPFVLFGRKSEPPKGVQYLGKVLPNAVMAVLIIFCIKNISFASLESFLPQIISIFLVAILHIWKKNNLLSIVLGTACYMFLIQAVFV